MPLERSVGSWRGLRSSPRQGRRGIAVLLFLGISSLAATSGEQQFLQGCLEGCGNAGHSATRCKTYCECSVEEIRNSSNPTIGKLLKGRSVIQSPDIVKEMQRITRECSGRVGE